MIHGRGVDLSMKILQIAPYFIPYIGGQEIYIKNLCKYLIKKGHDIDLIVSNFPKSKKRERYEGINIFRYSCIIRPLRNPISPSFFIPDQEIKGYDVIHTHNEHSYAAITSIFHSVSKRKPLVITCHGQLFFGNPIIDFIEKIYSKIIGKIIFTKANAIIVLSSSDKKYVESLGIKPEKIHIIPNGIDPIELNTDQLSNQEIESFRVKNNLSNKFIILFVGQIIHRKGILYLLYSIPLIIKKTKKDVLFLFIGNGDYYYESLNLVKELEIEKNTLFTGSVSKKDLIAFYQSSNLFILPSLSEGLPTTILEAMYFNLPVISSDIPGVRDHFADHAILVQPRDSQKIADAVIHILDNEELARELSSKGKEFILSHYTWDKIICEYEKIFLNLKNTEIEPINEKN